jgi:hypothetical protein
MRRTMWAQGGLLTALLATSAACAPSLDTVTIAQGTDFNLIRVEAKVRGAAAVSLGTPKVSIALVQTGQEPTFHQVGNMSLVTTPLYRRDAIPVPRGVIRAQVTVPYSVLFQSGTRTLTRTLDYPVPIPDGCFFFEGGDPGVFTADGFFEIVGPPPARILCPGESPLLTRGNNFPREYTSAIPGDFSSLAIPTNIPCIATPPPLQSGFIDFDFVSPNLTGLAGWAGANGFEVEARVPLGGSVPATQVRAQLIFQDTAGQFHAEVDGAGNVVFHNLGGSTWQALSMTRPGFQVANVHVRMFIPRTNTLATTESRIEIDRLCPRTGS